MYTTECVHVWERGEGERGEGERGEGGGTLVKYNDNVWLRIRGCED